MGETPHLMQVKLFAFMSRVRWRGAVRFRNDRFSPHARLSTGPADGCITLTVLDHPKLPRPGVPRTLERQIHHTMVEADRLPICPNGSLM